VDTIKKGDKVVLPFNVGLRLLCKLRARPRGDVSPAQIHPSCRVMAGAAYGFAGYGTLLGGKAQLLRVP